MKTIPLKLILKVKKIRDVYLHLLVAPSIRTTVTKTIF